MEMETETETETENLMERLILIRGLPGSGKSTFAKSMMRTGLLYDPYQRIFETDQYWERPDGEYDFNFKLLGHAHGWNEERAEHTLMTAHNHTIIVANTFTTLWEIQPYLDIAYRVDTKVKVYSLFDGGLSDQELADRCIHGVPVKTIKKMRIRWEGYTGEEWIKDETD